jgi:hypothetical protein
MAAPCFVSSLVPLSSRSLVNGSRPVYTHSKSGIQPISFQPSPGPPPRSLSRPAISPTWRATPSSALTRTLPPQMSTTPSSSTSRIAHLRSLDSIRSSCSKVFALAEQGQLEYWDLDLSREGAVVDYVCGLIARDYGTNYASIPPHGRWRHFVGGRVDPLLAQWRADRVDEMEVTR